MEAPFYKLLVTRFPDGFWNLKISADVKTGKTANLAKSFFSFSLYAAYSLYLVGLHLCSCDKLEMKFAKDS